MVVVDTLSVLMNRFSGACGAQEATTEHGAAEERNTKSTTSTITSTPVVRTDPQIRQDVLDELDWDTRVTHVYPNEIVVTVKDGIVTLTGRVDSYSKRWAAQEAALRVLGVKAVANDLEVRLHPASERTD